MLHRLNLQQPGCRSADQSAPAVSSAHEGLAVSRDSPACGAFPTSLTHSFARITFTHSVCALYLSYESIPLPKCCVY